MNDTSGLFADGAAGSAPEAPGNYVVLARKYRPANFGELLGQDVLVRTLTNAFEAGRIAHAFLFVGVRGVGKTTTARIIARGLNCTREDRPTVTPCGTCDSCRAALDDRHLDIIEIDAASHTGVDDVRELTDAGRYRPVSGRYKVFIVDEVHMLSMSAFNALLKTLEEPPEHLIFIFCTTELRKLPVTVLSRCQRFDLPRVPFDVLVAHFRDVAAREGATIDDEALQVIARAADGSVRDGLSLLDRAITHQSGGVTGGATREMLGLADRAGVYDLFDLLMAGKPGEALERLGGLYEAGADPVAVIEDLLGLTHWLSRLVAVPGSEPPPDVPADAGGRAAEMAGRLGVPVLARTWQMLLKALDEVRRAPDARAAVEMAMIRLCHVADLPDPGRLVRGARKEESAAAPAAPEAPAAPPPSPAPRGTAPAEARAQPEPEAAAPPPPPRLETFEGLLAHLGDRREVRLRHDLERFVHLVDYAPGRIEFRVADDAPADFANTLAGRLRKVMDRRWVVALVAEGGAETVRERLGNRRAEVAQEFEDGPVLAGARAPFPEAKAAIQPMGAARRRMEP